MPAQVIKEALPVLQKLKKDGLVRHIGFSCYPLACFHKMLDRWATLLLSSFSRPSHTSCYAMLTTAAASPWQLAPSAAVSWSFQMLVGTVLWAYGFTAAPLVCMPSVECGFADWPTICPKPQASRAEWGPQRPAIARLYIRHANVQGGAWDL